MRWRLAYAVGRAALYSESYCRKRADAVIFALHCYLHGVDIALECQVVYVFEAVRFRPGGSVQHFDVCIWYELINQGIENTVFVRRASRRHQDNSRWTCYLELVDRLDV